ncbi:MAG: hypothetical protein ACOH1N_08575 [Lutibacter sp.]
MAKTNTIQENHTAGPIAIGFDYQFYLFMFLALELKHGQKIGFEVKDDIHIDKSDGTTILFQAKHTIQKNSDGLTHNLTTLDTDLWKTLSNWATFIKEDTTKSGFINKHSFILITNKSENNNEFISVLSQFNIDKDVEVVLTALKKLADKTKDVTIKKYINSVTSLGKRKLNSFLPKLNIETSTDDVIEKIKNRILENVRQEKFIEPIFESLSSNLHLAKYLDIKDRNKFEISFEVFNIRFGKCFNVAFEKGILPKRNLPILLPEDLESQIFIRQLIDIGEVQSGSNDIIKFTTAMLKFLNDFTFWSEEENFFQLTDAEDFKKNSIQIWSVEFRAKYRQIEKHINSGTSLIELEDDIKNLGVDLVDYLRKQDLSIQGYLPLGVEYSNGHYYALSDNLEIGWHFDWENKYKEK